MKTAISLAIAVIALATATVSAAGTIIKHSPKVTAHASIVNDQVRVNLTVLPYYRVTRPGITVKLTNCRLGQQIPLKVVDSPALMDGNYDLSIKPGHVTWKILRTPAKPDIASMKLALALPQGKTGPKFCFHVAMHDNYTGKNGGFDLRLTIPALTGTSI